MIAAMLLLRNGTGSEWPSAGNNDLWIAAHARAEAWIPVTNNERDFSRVEGLSVENRA